MKRLPPLLLLAAPYAIAAIFVWTPAPSAALILWLAMVVLVFAPNMAYAFWLPKLGWDGRRLLFWGLMLKVCNLPFFLAVFLFCLLTFPFSIPLLIPLFLFDVSLLLPSAAYGASGALCALREGRLSRRAAIVFRGADVCVLSGRIRRGRVLLPGQAREAHAGGGSALSARAEKSSIVSSKNASAPCFGTRSRTVSGRYSTASSRAFSTPSRRWSAPSICSIGSAASERSSVSMMLACW